MVSELQTKRKTHIAEENWKLLVAIKNQMENAAGSFRLLIILHRYGM